MVLLPAATADNMVKSTGRDRLSENIFIVPDQTHPTNLDCDDFSGAQWRQNEVVSRVGISTYFRVQPAYVSSLGQFR